MEQKTLKKFPEWKEGIPQILETYAIGEVIPLEELYLLFDSDPTEPDISVDTYQKRRMRFMGDLDRLKNILLLEYKRDLQNIRGQGYRIVPPSEQAEVAEREAHDGIIRLLVKADLRVSNTELALLNADEKRRHMDVQVRLTNLSQMAKTERMKVPHLRDFETIETEVRLPISAE